MKRISFFIMVIYGLASCKKEEVPFYSGADGITFYISPYATDSISYSFAFQPIGTEKDTIFLQMRALGTAKGYDRVVKVVPGTGTTAREGVDFKFPEVVMPADSLTLSYPVVIYNTDLLADQSMRIVARIGVSDDFVVGATGLETGGTRAVDSYKIWISNKVDRPIYWSDIEYYFGAFSETKFRFMISVLGITDFSYENIGTTGLYNFPLQLSNALEEYKQANNGEPLLDENEQEVTFP